MRYLRWLAFRRAWRQHVRSRTTETRSMDVQCLMKRSKFIQKCLLYQPELFQNGRFVYDANILDFFQLELHRECREDNDRFLFLLGQEDVDTMHFFCEFELQTLILFLDFYMCDDIRNDLAAIISEESREMYLRIGNYLELVDLFSNGNYINDFRVIIPIQLDTRYV